MQRPGRRLPEDQATLDLAEEAIAHALESGRPEKAWDLYVNVLGGHRHLAWKLGEMARGLRILRGFDPCPDRWALGWYLRAMGELEAACEQNPLPYFRADVRLLQGRLPQVEAEGDLGRTEIAAFLMGRTTRLPADPLGCAIPRAQILLYQGRAGRAWIAAEPEEIYELTGWEDDRARCRLYRAEAACRMDDRESMSQSLEAAARWVLHSGSMEHLCLYHLVRARIAQRAGDFAAAGLAADEGLHVARHCGFRLYHVELLCVQAELLPAAASRRRSLAGRIAGGHRRAVGPRSLRTRLGTGLSIRLGRRRSRSSARAVARGPGSARRGAVRSSTRSTRSGSASATIARSRPRRSSSRSRGGVSRGREGSDQDVTRGETRHDRRHIKRRPGRVLTALVAFGLAGFLAMIERTAVRAAQADAPVSLRSARAGLCQVPHRTLTVLDDDTNKPFAEVMILNDVNLRFHTFPTDPRGQLRFEYPYIGSKPGLNIEVARTVTSRFERPGIRRRTESAARFDHLEAPSRDDEGGIVVYAADRPVEGVTVVMTVNGYGQEKRPENPTGHEIDDEVPTRTGPDGRWRTDSVPRGQIGQTDVDPSGLRIRWLDHSRAAGRHPEIADLRAQTDRQVMTKGASIRGRILDQDGQPIATSGVDSTNGLTFLKYIGRAFTDAEGRFQIHLPRGGDVTLTAQVEGHQPKTMKVPAELGWPAQSSFACQRARCFDLRGVVDPEDKPIAGDSVIIPRHRQTQRRLPPPMDRCAGPLCLEQCP